MDDLSLRDFGANGLLIEFAQVADESSLSRCRGLLRALEEYSLDDLGEVVPAYGSILLEFGGQETRKLARGLLPEILSKAVALPSSEARLHEIPVVYDGPDLEALAQRTGLSVAEVIRLHSAVEYSVFLIGFSPGFPYLGPLDERLHAPRLESPRLKVPAGSVGIGGEHTGIYGISSPGGWWLIGRTAVELYSLAKAEGDGDPSAFLLRQGERVKFVPVNA
ncbi:5-oxoprolinase subunit PxpB [soil metagenome]